MFYNAVIEFGKHATIRYEEVLVFNARSILSGNTQQECPGREANHSLPSAAELTNGEPIPRLHHDLKIRFFMSL
jgi:hypothetical protein